MEKQKRLVGYFVLLVFSLIFSIVLVSAGITINSPVTNGNYTTTLNVSITSDLLNTTKSAYNVTLYCNKSGGSVASRIAGDNITTIWNSTDLTSNFENATVSISSLTDVLKLYNCSAYGDNGTTQNWSVAVKNITIDNTPPNVSFSGITNTINNGNYSGTIILNVSVDDPIMGVDSVYFNITNSSGTQLNFSNATASGGYYNLSLITSGFVDGKYNITVHANDTRLNNLNKTERIQITIDNTGPAVTFSCSPSTVNVGYPVTCSCAGTDETSGVLTTTFTASPLTDAAGTFTETCTVTNYVGNSTNSTATYTVSYSGGNIPSGGGGGGGASKTDTNTWTKITPGVAAIIKDFDKDIGVKQIQIEVNNIAQNVQIIVNKYDSKPTNVSVEKTDTYKYLSIVTKNIKENLSRAVMEFQVNKSWISNKNLDKTDIALFKYNEVANQWDELTTTFKEEDSTYYYYDAELTSFSYFAIAPKEQPPVVEEVQQETNLGGQEQGTFLQKLLAWGWIIIAVVVLVGLVALFTFKKKKRNKKKIRLYSSQLPDKRKVKIKRF